MALTPAVSILNSSVAKRTTDANLHMCWGSLTFAASDVYTAGGMDIRALIRKLYGVRDVLFIKFLGSSSNAIGTTTYGTSRVIARYVYQPAKIGVAESAVVKVFSIGRTAAGAPVASEVELATNDNVRGATGTGLVFPFVAYCMGDAFTGDSQMGPN